MPPQLPTTTVGDKKKKLEIKLIVVGRLRHRGAVWRSAVELTMSVVAADRFGGRLSRLCSSRRRRRTPWDSATIRIFHCPSWSRDGLCDTDDVVKRLCPHSCSVSPHACGWTSSATCELGRVSVSLRRTICTRIVQQAVVCVRLSFEICSTIADIGAHKATASHESRLYES